MLGETVGRDGWEKLWLFKHQNGNVYGILTGKNVETWRNMVVYIDQMWWSSDFFYQLNGDVCIVEYNGDILSSQLQGVALVRFLSWFWLAPLGMLHICINVDKQKRHWTCWKGERNQPEERWKIIIQEFP